MNSDNKKKRGGLRSTSFKTKSEEGQAVNVHFRLKPELNAKLSEMAQNKGMTKTGIIEELIERG